MTEKRRYCPKGHDTIATGRDSSYRCLICKRESGRAARDRRRAEEQAAQAAHQAELVEGARRYDAMMRRRREKLARDMAKAEPKIILPSGLE